MGRERRQVFEGKGNSPAGCSDGKPWLYGASDGSGMR